MSNRSLNLTAFTQARRVLTLTAHDVQAILFRCAVFAAGASLAVYIPFKYTTQLHAISGIYAVLFPFSAILAFAGMAIAMKPGAGCDCSVKTRTAVGALAMSWAATGLLCVSSLLEMAHHSTWGAGFAAFHMIAQHVFLSSVIVAVALAPRWMARKLGTEVTRVDTSASVELSGAHAC